ncbi:MAG: Bug family tripartite tricarboxylate transporter substrate binding protein [Rhodospirillaceae bacterium]
MSTAEPTRLVIGFSPGSLSDRIARAIAGPLSNALNEAVEVVGQPGENGAPAARGVARSRPDGRTLFVATLGTHALACHVTRDLPYDPSRDFAPVALLAQAPLLLACHPDVPARSTADLVALARERRGAITYASSAIGGAPHLAAALFQSIAGVELRHICYARTEQLYRDLEAGDVMLSFNNIVSMLPVCRRGALRALGVSSASRSSLAPDVPTLQEEGVADYEVTNWAGLVAPRGTPQARIEELHAATNVALETIAVRDAWATAGMIAPQSTPTSFSTFIAEEIDRWRTVAANLDTRAERRA